MDLQELLTLVEEAQRESRLRDDALRAAAQRVQRQEAELDEIRAEAAEWKRRERRAAPTDDASRSELRAAAAVCDIQALLAASEAFAAAGQHALAQASLPRLRSPSPDRTAVVWEASRQLAEERVAFLEAQAAAADADWAAARRPPTEASRPSARALPRRTLFSST